jgi:glycosyltransferase involved in cell wall biosynthesis
MPIRPFVPVPEKQKAELRRRLGLDEGTRVLLSVGRLSSEKGHMDLVQAFSRIVGMARPSRLRLVIVGDGPERPRVERCCRDLGLTGLVTLTGQQEDVNPYYGIADVFVLPSRSEGCPNVLLEAMAAGVPVVATQVGGVPETVTNGKEAILVKRQDHDGLALATARILKDADLRARLVSAARQVAGRKTPEAYFKSIASVFSQACTNAN